MSVADVLVVGAGHNGLIAALRLARAGCRVTVVEQGTEPGGCVWTEVHPSGVLVERGAFEHGGLYPTAAELGLDDAALGDRAVRYREHPVLAGVVFGDGQRRTFYTDVAATAAALGADGPGYRRLVELAGALFGLLDTFDTPPTLTQVAAALAVLPGGDDLFRIVVQSAETVLETAVSDPHTHAAMAVQSAHAQVPAWAPGSGLLALLLPASHRGAAVRPAGGSRAVVDALVAALERAGATVRTGAGVVAMGSADGRGGSGGRVELADGAVLTADAVVSSIGLPRTAELLTDPAPALRATARGLHSGHFNIAELTVTVVHDRARSLPLPDPEAVWYAVPAPADVRTGFAEVLAGRLPSSPWSMVGQVSQPDGVTGGAVWLSSIVPLVRADGDWTPERERQAADRVIDQVGSVLGVDLRAGLVDVVVSGPLTWSARIGGDGNPNHLDNTLDQLLGWRPPGHADTRSELPWLFLAGAGQHPGGGLSGASGSAAAAAVLGTRRRARPDRRVVREIRALWSGLTAYRAMRRGL